MAAFFHIDLEEIAHVIKRRRCCAQMPLLLNRAWLCVALNDDEAAQARTMFARNVLPGLFALARAKVD